METRLHAMSAWREVSLVSEREVREKELGMVVNAFNLFLANGMPQVIDSLNRRGAPVLPF